MGVTFDGWQDGANRITLAMREDGRYAATIGGVVWSIPRQVGKTFTIGSVIFALCILYPNLTVLWTAHRTKTANETFRSMQGMAKRSKIAPYVANIYRGSGDESIEFHNGSRILFGAREQGFGRGFTEVDIIMFDEAQILTDKALDDMVASSNQSRQAAGPLLFFTGTPPRPIDPGEAFRRMRAEALSGNSDDLVYIEFSADSDADLDDRRQWAKANPSYPHRTPPEAIVRLRKMLSEDSFRREALGIWDDDDFGKVFGPGKWEAAGGPDVDAKPGCLVVATSVDGSMTCIASASVVGERYVAKTLEYGPGQSWAVESLRALYGLHRVPVVLDARGPAAALTPLLEAAKVRVEPQTTVQVLDAHANLFQLVQDGRFGHGRYPELDAAVAGATTRTVGDRWMWGRRKSSVDISPLEAVTLGVGFLYRPPFVSVYEERGALTL
jgi:hypothetical protein